MTMVFRFIPVAALTFCLVSQAQADLAPHRAIYDLKSENVDKRGGILSVEGRLAYEVTGNNCEGWSTNYRFVNRYVRAEGVTQLTDTQLAAWESGPGDEMQISQKQFVDQSLQDEVNLSAKLTAGKEGASRIIKPSEKTFVLPLETQFPLAQQKQLLKSATEKKQRHVSLLYDGSDAEKVFQVVSLIGEAKLGRVAGTPAANVAEMKNMPSWSVSAGYYEVPDTKADIPNYQTSFVVFENGVTSEVAFDYGTYVLRGKLTKLDMLPVQKCE